MATYQESTGGTLPFYNTQIEALLNKGQALAGQQATTAGMPAQTVAGFQPLQQQAFDLTQQNVGAYQPLLDQSQQAIQAYQQGAQFDPSQIAQYMNPYVQNVVSEIGRLGNERFTNEMLPGLSSSFGGLGQFGSARQAALMADAAAKSQREVLGQQSQALNTGYQNAMQQYQDWTNMGLGANQQAATQFGNLAQAQQQMGLSDIGALSSAGALQQQQQQKVQDLPFVNWQQQQAYPWQSLNNWANLFKAGTPQQTTSWNTSFKDGGLVEMAGGGSILERMRKAGMSDQDIFDQFDTGGPTFRQSLGLPAVPKSQPIEISSDSAVDQKKLAEIQNRFVQEAFKERMDTLKRVREIQPEPDPHWSESVGRAMMAAGAQGPANFGQLIGRAGTHYFEGEDAREQAKKNLALQKLALEDKVLPDALRLMVAQKAASGKGSGAISTYGKIAIDEGLVPGTEAFNARVNQLAERDFGVRKQSADTSRGHLTLRGEEQGFKYGPSTGIPSVKAPSISAPYPGFEKEDLPKVTSPAQQTGQTGMHPGIAQYESKGMPRKSAMERWETDQKEYDKLRQERSETSSKVTSGDIDRALFLNDRIEETKILPPVAFEAGPSWLPGATAAVGSKTGEYRSELNDIGARLIPELTKGLTPVSNVDAQSMAKAGIGAQNTYIVNKTNLQRAQSSVVLLKEQDAFYSWAEENGISPNKAKVEWNNYIKKYPLFDSKRAAKDGTLIYNIPIDNRQEILQGYLDRMSRGEKTTSKEVAPNSDPLDLR